MSRNAGYAIPAKRRWPGFLRPGTREAMADVDAGQVIDHQAVQAWADSLGTGNPLPTPALR